MIKVSIFITPWLTLTTIHVYINMSNWISNTLFLKIQIEIQIINNLICNMYLAMHYLYGILQHNLHPIFLKPSGNLFLLRQKQAQSVWCLICTYLIRKLADKFHKKNTGSSAMMFWSFILLPLPGELNSLSPTEIKRTHWFKWKQRTLFLYNSILKLSLQLPTPAIWAPKPWPIISIFSPFIKVRLSTRYLILSATYSPTVATLCIRWESIHSDVPFSQLIVIKVIFCLWFSGLKNTENKKINIFLYHKCRLSSKYYI